MWAVRTKSGRCGATTSRTLKVRGDFTSAGSGVSKHHLPIGGLVGAYEMI